MSFLLAGCATWKGDYKEGLAKVDVLLKEGESLVLPQDKVSYGFQIDKCDSVVERSRKLKDELSSLPTNDVDPKRAKDLLMDVLEKNAESAQSARYYTEALMAADEPHLLSEVSPTRDTFENLLA